MLAIKILLVEVSLTKSLSSYEVDADQLPLKVPSSCVTASSPDESKDKTYSEEMQDKIEPIGDSFTNKILKGSG